METIDKKDIDTIAELESLQRHEVLKDLVLMFVGSVATSSVSSISPHDLGYPNEYKDVDIESELDAAVEALIAEVRVRRIGTTGLELVRRLNPRYAPRHHATKRPRKYTKRS